MKQNEVLKVIDEQVVKFGHTSLDKFETPAKNFVVENKVKNLTFDKKCDLFDKICAPIIYGGADAVESIRLYMLGAVENEVHEEVIEILQNKPGNGLACAA